MTAVLVLLWLLPAATDIRPRERLTEQRVRALTRQSPAEAGGESTALVLALDRRVREWWEEE